MQKHTHKKKKREKEKERGKEKYVRYAHKVEFLSVPLYKQPSIKEKTGKLLVTAHNERKIRIMPA